MVECSILWIILNVANKVLVFTLFFFFFLLSDFQAHRNRPFCIIWDVNSRFTTHIFLYFLVAVVKCYEIEQNFSSGIILCWKSEKEWAFRWLWEYDWFLVWKPHIYNSPFLLGFQRNDDGKNEERKKNPPRL